MNPVRLYFDDYGDIDCAGNEQVFAVEKDVAVFVVGCGGYSGFVDCCLHPQWDKVY